MTNEEKALEMFPDTPTLECMCKGVRKRLVEMAEWKDRQFKEYLEKKLVDIRKENSCGPYGVGCNQGAQRAVNEIIDELFGEIEQDNSDREE